MLLGCWYYWRHLFKHALEDDKLFCCVNIHHFVMLWETIYLLPFWCSWTWRFGFSYLLAIPSHGYMSGLQLVVLRKLCILYLFILPIIQRISNLWYVALAFFFLVGWLFYLYLFNLCSYDGDSPAVISGAMPFLLVLVSFAQFIGCFIDLFYSQFCFCSLQYIYLL